MDHTPFDKFESYIRTKPYIEDVKILFACESGSRAWGFDSPDSDYDVRFIYCRDKDWYLSLERQHDTIEVSMITGIGQIDVAGWDIAKFLRLAKNGNAAAFEWLYRCPVYFMNRDWTELARYIMKDYIDPISMAYHYLGMARKHWARYVWGKEVVQRKKYLYLFRAIINAQWYIDQALGGTDDLAPASFVILSDHVQLPYAVYRDLALMLKDKRDGKEIGEGPPIESFDEYIEAYLESTEITEGMRANRLGNLGWKQLNNFFITTLENYSK